MTDPHPVDVAPCAPPSPPGADPAAVLRAVAEATAAAAAAGDADARLRALLAGMRALGFGRAVLERRDAAMDRTDLLCEGFDAADARALPAALVAGRVWRRWLRLLERRREQIGVGGGYWLDLRDPWARDEFGAALGGEASAGVLVLPVRAADGACWATVLLEGPTGDAPSPWVGQGVAVLAGHMSQECARADLADLAAQRAERLQRLYDAGGALARSLDAQEIVRELARQVARLVPHDGLVVAHPDVERGVVRTAIRQLHGLQRPRADQPLGSGPIAEVAHTGLTVRVDDYDPALSPLAAADDLVGDGGPARSVLAVPMRVGTQLVGVLAVHAAPPRAFGAEHEELLRTLAAQAGTALANARLFAESEAERRQSEALVAVARAVGASLRLGEVLRLVLRHTVGLLHTEGACIALRRDGWLHVVAGVGCVELLAGVHLPVEGSLFGGAMHDGTSLVLNDVARQAPAVAALDGVAPIAKTVVVPLRTSHGVIGTIAVVNRATDFGAEDARVLARLAEQVAVAIVNARLFEEAEASTREWQVSFDAIAAGMAVLDEDGRIVRCNARAAELLGVDAPRALHGASLDARLAGRDETGRLGHANVAPVVHDGEDHEDERASDGTAASASVLVRRAIRQGAPARSLVRAAEGVSGARAALTSDVEGRVFDLVAAPHPGGGAVVTFDDVTAQLALAERHRSVVETTGDAIVISDRSGRITFANPAAIALFGRGDALIGTDSTELVRPDDLDEVARRMSRGRSGESQRYEVTIVRPDGDERRLEVSTAPLREVGAVSGVVASLRDVTDARRAQAAIRASEARYSRLVESASDAIFTVDALGRLTSVNRAMELATGHDRASLLGQHCSATADPRDREAVTAILEATLRGERVRRELRYRDRQGRARVASVITSPVIENGVVDGALGVVRDVTGERRLAEQLLQREKLAAMGQLVSGVAHELNNPLAGVLAFSELLLAEPALDAESGAQARELRELTDTIHREARRAARIVGKLLAFARQHPPQRAATDLNRVVLEALDLRRYALRTQQVDIALALDYELPATWADGPQLQQVFLNLITNAEHALVRHAGERRLTVTTRREGERLCVVVADSGPGLTAEERQRIFEPFYTTKPIGEGTGLGLAVSSGIVRDHGGRLSVESTPGGGAAFTVELPCVAPLEERPMIASTS
ncbi:MAG: PAS domain S-box protein [Gemmatirosa sp.]